MRILLKHLAFITLFFVIQILDAKSQPQGHGNRFCSVNKDSLDFNQLKNPAKQFRTLAFWSWNGNLQDDELRWQIGQLDEQGWGGFFMHARAGLITPYLSEDWFARCKASVAEAGRRGMFAWLYDENKWPSGTADFKIPFMDKAYRETHLFMADSKIAQNRNDISLYKILYQPKESTKSPSLGPLDYRPISKVQRDELARNNYPNTNDTASFRYFYSWKAPLGNERFGGGSYVDLLNPDVARTFVKLTHDQYKKNLSNSFGTIIPGIFTDDITLIWDLYGIKKNALPWTDQMPAIFKQWHGYDIEDQVDKLYLRLPGYEKVRVDFYRTVNRLFAESYWKVLSDWSAENGLCLSGHHMGDGAPYIDLMQNFEYEQVPALDLLDLNLGHFLSLRAIISIANQLGKERTLCEAFAACGQNLSFEGQKWLSDWLFVNGINAIASHITMYTMEGERKRDHPPVFGYQQPWWKFNRYIADYQARVSYLLTRGNRVSDILLLDPVESFGMAYTPSNPSEFNSLSIKFQSIMRMLMENHLDFDLGSEEIISKYGSLAKNTIQVGKATYKVLVLPPALAIRKSTFKLISDFQSQGGQVIAVERVPGFIDGILADEEEKKVLSNIFITSKDQLVSQIMKLNTPDIQVNLENDQPAGSVYYQQRKVSGKRIFFLANRDNSHSYSTSISLKGKGNLLELDLSTGEKKPVPAQYSKGATSFQHTFPSAGSLAFIFDESENPIPFQKPDHQQISLKIPLDSLWKIKFCTENALTIDYCSYSTDGIIFSEPEYCLKVSEMLKKDTRIKFLRYHFVIDSLSDFKANLVTETPNKFNISVNGHPITFGSSDYFVDKSFRKTSVAKFLKTGKNQVDFQLIDPKGNQIESIYITGDFYVSRIGYVSFSLEPIKKKANINDLVSSGFPFFKGTVQLEKMVRMDESQTKQKISLKFNELNATVARVFVNDHLAGAVFWKPYEIDISGLLKSGENIIRIELTNSLHNLLGPHHNAEKENLHFVNPNSFKDYKNWSDSYFFRPFGVSGIYLELNK